MCIEGKDNKETMICTHYSRGEKDDKYSSSNKSTLEDGTFIIGFDWSQLIVSVWGIRQISLSANISRHVLQLHVNQTYMYCNMIQVIFFPSDAPTKRKGNLFLTISECNWSARLILFKACCTSHNNKKKIRDADNWSHVPANPLKGTPVTVYITGLKMIF